MTACTVPFGWEEAVLGVSFVFSPINLNAAVWSSIRKSLYKICCLLRRFVRFSLLRQYLLFLVRSVCFYVCISVSLLAIIHRLTEWYLGHLQRMRPPWGIGSSDEYSEDIGLLCRSLHEDVLCESYRISFLFRWIVDKFRHSSCAAAKFEEPACNNPVCSFYLIEA